MGILNGTAFTDSCGNCVGGNTGNVACIAFSPTVGVILSNTDCDSLTDLTINVSQDPNEPDMSTALFTSDGGSFAISSFICWRYCWFCCYECLMEGTVKF